MFLELNKTYINFDKLKWITIEDDCVSLGIEGGTVEKLEPTGGNSAAVVYEKLKSIILESNEEIINMDTILFRKTMISSIHNDEKFKISFSDGVENFFELDSTAFINQL